MSEDSSFINNNKLQMKKDEHEFAPHSGSSSGKNQGDSEEQRGFSGLSPLGLFCEIHDSNLNSEPMEGFSAIETLKNSGLTPLRPGGEIHDRNLNSRPEDEDLSTIETLRNSSGLAPLRPGGEIYDRNLNKKSGDKEYIETLRNSSGLTPLNPGSQKECRFK